MTNTIGATPEERELIERACELREACRIGVEKRRVMPSYVDACVTLNALAPKLLSLCESLISDRAKLREALKMAVKMLDEGGFAYPAEWLSLVNTTKGQNNDTE